MTNSPLVTIMIATKNRHDDLRVTLEDLQRQDYPNLEMLVIDDASTPAIAELVYRYWPQARVVRYEVSKGQAARRNEGFAMASGDFVLQLDDDCSPVASHAISSSVRVMQENPRCAAIAYYTWNGMELPAGLEKNGLPPSYVLSYIGAAGFVRKAAIAETTGYQVNFFGYAEEEELGLQFLQRGWSIIMRPELVAHHRMSAVNRSTDQSWKRSLRNRLWTILIHMPWSRVPIEVGWKLIGEAWEAIRLGRTSLYLQAIAEALKDRQAAMAVRRPLDELPLRRYDALRAHGSLTPEQFANPPKQGLGMVRRWLSRRSNRLRQASRWSKEKNVGRGDMPSHEHELRG